MVVASVLLMAFSVPHKLQLFFTLSQDVTEDMVQHPITTDQVCFPQTKYAYALVLVSHSSLGSSRGMLVLVVLVLVGGVVVGVTLSYQEATRMQSLS